MDLQEHYRQLASYDEWANLAVIAVLRSAGQPLERARKLMAHIISAEHVWLTRIEQRPAPFPVWPELSLEQCVKQAHALAKSWPGLLEGDGGILDSSVHYKNSKGEADDSLVRDILSHVFMPSAVLRGPLAS